MDRGIVIFDGYCNFCSGSVLFIIPRDKHGYFLFTASQTAAGKEIISRYHLGEMATHSIVLVEAGKVYRKSDAVLRIARRLSGGWPLFYVCMIIPRRVRDFFYDLIAQRRYRIFGMSDSCFMPEPSISERFLPND